MWRFSFIIFLHFFLILSFIFFHFLARLRTLQTAFSISFSIKILILILQSQFFSVNGPLYKQTQTCYLVWSQYTPKNFENLVVTFSQILNLLFLLENASRTTQNFLSFESQSVSFIFQKIRVISNYLLPNLSNFIPPRIVMSLWLFEKVLFVDSWPKNVS